MKIIILILIAMTLSIVGLGTNRNLIKTIIFLNLLQSNVILLFISFNYNNSLVPPILIDTLENLSDPMPQALMITAIVIGASITSLALMFSIKIFHNFGTLDWDVIKKRMD